MTGNQKLFLALSALMCGTVVVLYYSNPAGAKCPECPEVSTLAATSTYGDCVRKAFASLERTNKVRYIDVSGSIDKLVTIGPKSLSEEEHTRLQQTLAAEAQPIALAHCAEAARDHPLVLLVGVDTQRRRKDIHVSTVGTPRAECKTDSTGSCLLSIVGLSPSSRLHLKAHSANLASATQTFDYRALTSGLVKLELTPQQNRLLTIQAKIRAEAFPGWISVSFPSAESTGEITSEECYETADWDSPKCRTVRADDFGRGSFVYDGSIDSIVVELAYRSQTTSMTVPVKDGHAEVQWRGGSGSSPSTEAPKGTNSPCGNRGKIERVLDAASWSRTEVIRVAISVDAQGGLTPTAGVPAPVAGFVTSKRIRVEPNCIAQTHEFPYHARADDP